MSQSLGQGKNIAGETTKPDAINSLLKVPILNSDSALYIVDTLNRIASSFPTNFLKIISFEGLQELRRIPASELAYLILSWVTGTSSVDPLRLSRQFRTLCCDLESMATKMRYFDNVQQDVTTSQNLERIRKIIERVGYIIQEKRYSVI